MDLHNALNPEQRAAVEHTHGPQLVLAGAGSGKTRVITYRLAHLIDQGHARPEEILCLTFTNKASKEMQERAVQLAGPDASGATLSTFHSACARWLRRHGRLLGFTAGFSIYDVDDQVALLRTTAERLGMPHDKAAAKRFKGHIEKIKQRALRPRQVEERSTGRDAEMISRLYREYQEDLKRANAMDFGDLIAHVVHLLEDDDDLRRGFRMRYRFVMIDEFQDTNVAQYRLIRQLVPPDGNVTVVGDDDQSIYRWRGASVENVRRFQHEYDDCHVVTLERNYRSTSGILDAAHTIVEKLPNRMPKKLHSHRGGGEPVRAFVGRDDREEADFIGRTIKRMHTERDLRYAEFAIFVRTNAQTRVLEDRLRRMGIGYEIVSGLSFFERKEIKDLMGYLRLVANPADEIAFRRVVNLPPRGVGSGTLAQIELWRQQAGYGSLVEALRTFDESPGRRPNRRTRAGLRQFDELLTELDRMSRVVTVEELLETILTELDYERYLIDSDPDSAEDRLRNVDELRSAAADFSRGGGREDLAAFLEYASLRQAIDATTDDATRVPIMTVHASKGLEFPVVFVTGMEQNLFPLSRRGEPATTEELEEERRLCYVAYTRAEDFLFLTAARRRQLYGRPQPTEPSEFLLDLPEEQVELVAESSSDRDWSASSYGAGGGPRRRGASHHDDFDQRPWQERLGGSESVPDQGVVFDDSYYPTDTVNAARSYVGKRARHKLFGIGKIAAADPAGAKVKLTIDFPKVGRKRVILRFVEVLD